MLSEATSTPSEQMSARATVISSREPRVDGERRVRLVDLAQEAREGPGADIATRRLHEVLRAWGNLIRKLVYKAFARLASSVAHVTPTRERLLHKLSLC